MNIRVYCKGNTCLAKNCWDLIPV